MMLYSCENGLSARFPPHREQVFEKEVVLAYRGRGSASSPLANGKPVEGLGKSFCYIGDWFADHGVACGTFFLSIGMPVPI